MLKTLNRETADVKKNYPIKVLQFGDGNFMRAFMDWMIDILNEKAGFKGSVQIVRPLRRGKEDRRFEQDGLYHVVQRGFKNGKTISEAQLITCVSEVINPYSDFQKFLTAAENPELQFITSNTTEAGIVFNQNDTQATILPESFPGKVALLLYHRFVFFKKDPKKGLIHLPCELIENNGDRLREIILQYSTLWSLPNDFKEWITHNNIFCNTLVDRIVPGYPKEGIDEIQKDLGYEDHLMVMAEPYHFLALEASESVRRLFPAEQTELNVKFVSDITPYRVRKVRILNGAHTALVPIAYLRGLRTVKESINDPYVNEFIREAIDKEIIPTLDLSKEELSQFAADVIERFQNPFIRHELISIALNSISKFKVRVLPTILEYEKRTGKLPKRLLQSFAALIVFYKGNSRGEPIPLNDSPDVLSFFKDTWSNNSPEEVVQKILSNTSFWDRDLTKINELPEAITVHVKKLID